MVFMFFKKHPPPFNLRVHKRKTTLWSNWAWPWSRQSCIIIKMKKVIFVINFRLPLWLCHLCFCQMLSETNQMNVKFWWSFLLSNYHPHQPSSSLWSRKPQFHIREKIQYSTKTLCCQYYSLCQEISNKRQNTISFQRK